MLASILICGTAFHALLLTPHALQLAFGWTRLLFFKNLIAVIALVPLIIYMTTAHGAIGAAYVWVILNFIVFLFEIPIMHRRILRGEEWKWYAQDVLFPLMASLLVAGMGKILMPKEMPQLMSLTYLLIISAATLAGTAAATSTTGNGFTRRR